AQPRHLASPRLPQLRLVLPAHSAAELKLQHRILMLPQQEPVSHQAN
ncbi:MAG: hypothetical protein RJA56_1731, partial [Pseudomonadota bacterium]